MKTALVALAYLGVLVLSVLVSYFGTLIGLPRWILFLAVVCIGYLASLKIESWRERTQQNG